MFIHLYAENEATATAAVATVVVVVVVVVVLIRTSCYIEYHCIVFIFYNVCRVCVCSAYFGIASPIIC